MTAELVATTILIAWSVCTFFVSILIFRLIIQKKLQEAIDLIGEALSGMLGNPTVKAAMTILGKKGGEANAENYLVDDMAKDILDSPQFAAIRLGAETMGLDLEGYIDKHGAMKTISAAQQIAKLVGVDLMHIDLNNITGSLASPAGGGSNPYLRR